MNAAFVGSVKKFGPAIEIQEDVSQLHGKDDAEQVTIENTLQFEKDTDVMP